MLKLFRTPQRCSVIYNKRLKCSSKDDNKNEKERQEEIARLKEKASFEEPPTTCCGTGCSNCVYIVWAEGLSKTMNSDPKIATKILKLVEDTSLRAYLEMELRLRGFKS